MRRKISSPATSTPVSGEGRESEEKLALILGSLEDDKAEEIVTIDLRGKSSIADYMVVASGRSNRHVGAICDHLVKKLKEIGEQPRSEGVAAGDWALIDASDVIAHVFRPEVREFYSLEKMWAQGPAERPTTAPTQVED